MASRKGTPTVGTSSRDLTGPKRVASAATFFSPRSPSSPLPLKESTKDYKARGLLESDDMSPIGSNSDLTLQAEYEMIQSRIETIVGDWDSKEADISINNGIGTASMSSNKKAEVLMTSLKSMQSMVQNMERHGISRDDVLGKLMQHFNSQHVVVKEDENTSTEEFDEAEKSIAEAGKVLATIEEAYAKAQEKMENIIEDVKVHITASRLHSPSSHSHRGETSPLASGLRPLITSFPSSKVVTTAERGNLDSVLNDLIAAKEIIASRDSELKIAHSSLKEATNKIQTLEEKMTRDHQKLITDLRMTQFQNAILMSKSKEKERTDRDVGLEVHIEQSRIQREAEMMKENLTKYVTKIKKITKELEEVQGQLASVKDELGSEQTKNCLLRSDVDEMRKKLDNITILHNRSKLKEIEDIENNWKLKLQEEQARYDAVDNENKSLRHQIEEMKGGYEELRQNMTTQLNTLKKEMEDASKVATNKLYEAQLRSQEQETQLELLRQQQAESVQMTDDKAVASPDASLVDELQRKVSVLEDELNESYGRIDVLNRKLIDAGNAAKIKKSSINSEALVMEVEYLREQVVEKDNIIEALRAGGGDDSTAIIQEMQEIAQSYANDTTAVKHQLKRLLTLTGLDIKEEDEEAAISSDDETSVISSPFRQSMMSRSSSNRAPTPILSVDNSLRVSVSVPDTTESIATFEVESKITDSSNNTAITTDVVSESVGMNPIPPDITNEIHDAEPAVPVESVCASETPQVESSTTDAATPTAPPEKDPELLSQLESSVNANTTVVDTDVMTNSNVNVQANDDAKIEGGSQPHIEGRNQPQSDVMPEPQVKAQSRRHLFQGTGSRSTDMLALASKVAIRVEKEIQKLKKNMEDNQQEAIKEIELLKKKLMEKGDNSEPIIRKKKKKVENSEEENRSISVGENNVKQPDTAVLHAEALQLQLENNAKQLEVSKTEIARLRTDTEYFMGILSRTVAVIDHTRTTEADFMTLRDDIEKFLKKEENGTIDYIPVIMWLQGAVATPLEDEKKRDDLGTRSSGQRSVAESVNSNLRGNGDDDNSYSEASTSQIVAKVIGPTSQKSPLTSPLSDNGSVSAPRKFRNSISGVVKEENNVKDVRQRRRSVIGIESGGDSNFLRTLKVKGASPRSSVTEGNTGGAADQDDEARKSMFSDEERKSRASVVSFVQHRSRNSMQYGYLNNPLENLASDQMRRRSTLVDCKVLALARAENDLQTMISTLDKVADADIQQMQAKRELLENQVQVLFKEVMNNKNQIVDQDSLDPSVDVSSFEKDTQILILQRIRYRLLNEISLYQKDATDSLRGLRDAKGMLQEVSNEIVELRKKIEASKGAVMSSQIVVLANEIHNYICETYSASLQAMQVLKMFEHLHMSKASEEQKQNATVVTNTTPDCSGNAILHHINFSADSLLPNRNDIFTPGFDRNSKRGFVQSLQGFSPFADVPPAQATDDQLQALEISSISRLGIVTHKALSSSQFTLSTRKGQKTKQPKRKSLKKLNLSQISQEVMSEKNNQQEMSSSQQDFDVVLPSIWPELSASDIPDNIQEPASLPPELENANQPPVTTEPAVLLPSGNSVVLEFTLGNPVDRIFDALPNAKLNFQNMKEEEILKELEIDSEKLSIIVQRMSFMRDEIYNLTPSQLHTEYNDLKKKLEDAIREKNESQLERDTLRKSQIQASCGALEMAEELFKKEKALKMMKSGENFRKFEASIKLKRVRDQLSNEIGVLDQKSRTALKNVRDLYKQEVLEKESRVQQLAADRQSYLTVLVQLYERVKKISNEVFGNELFTRLANEVKILALEDKYKQWESTHISDMFHETIDNLPDVCVDKFQDIDELPPLKIQNETRFNEDVPNNLTLCRSQLRSGQGQRAATPDNHKYISRQSISAGGIPNSPIKAGPREPDAQFISLRPHTSVLTNQTQSPKRVRPMFRESSTHTTLPISKFPGSTFGIASREKGSIFQAPKSSELKAARSEGLQFLVTGGGI